MNNIENQEMKAYMTLMEIIPHMVKLEEVAFGSCLCMILEEWCKAHDKDIVDYIHDISGVIEKVNNDLGRY